MIKGFLEFCNLSAAFLDKIAFVLLGEIHFSNKKYLLFLRRIRKWDLYISVVAVQLPQQFPHFQHPFKG